MRAHAAILVLTDLTIHAENLVSGREVLLSQPQVKTCASAFVQPGSPFGCAVVLYMVNRQEQLFSFPAAGAFPPAVRSKDLFSAPILVEFGFRLFRCPYCGNFFRRSVPQLSVAPLSGVKPGFFPVFFPPATHTLVNCFAVPLSIPCSGFAVLFALSLLNIKNLIIDLARCFHVIILHEVHRIRMVNFY